eukprot:5188840-Amphidinium_carterae.1
MVVQQSKGFGQSVNGEFVQSCVPWGEECTLADHCPSWRCSGWIQLVLSLSLSVSAGLVDTFALCHS